MLINEPEPEPENINGIAKLCQFKLPKSRPAQQSAAKMSIVLYLTQQKLGNYCIA